MDETMFSSGPFSFDSLQVHHISDQHPLMADPISISHPHVTTVQEANGQQHWVALENHGNPKDKPSLRDEYECNENGTESHMGKKGSSLWN